MNFSLVMGDGNFSGTYGSLYNAVHSEVTVEFVIDDMSLFDTMNLLGK